MLGPGVMFVSTPAALVYALRCVRHRPRNRVAMMAVVLALLEALAMIGFLLYAALLAR